MYEVLRKLGGIALAAAFGLVVGGVGINRLRGDIATANPPASLKLASPTKVQAGTVSHRS